jgi:hypothetical protein
LIGLKPLVWRKTGKKSTTKAHKGTDSQALFFLGALEPEVRLWLIFFLVV